MVIQYEIIKSILSYVYVSYIINIINVLRILQDDEFFSYKIYVLHIPCIQLFHQEKCIVHFHSLLVIINYEVMLISDGIFTSTYEWGC